MPPTVQVAQPVEAFDHQRQDRDQPANEQAVRMVMADVLHPVAVLGVVESLVLDLPPALRHPVKGSAGHIPLGKVGEPVRLVYLPIGFMLEITEDAHAPPP